MVELESEGRLTRNEAAEFLREFADELEDESGGHGTSSVDSSEELTADDVTETGPERRTESPTDTKRITLIVGGDSATVTVPDAVTLDVQVESRSPMLLSSGVNQEISIDLSWEIENPDEMDGDWIEVE